MGSGTLDEAIAEYSYLLGNPSSGTFPPNIPQGQAASSFPKDQSKLDEAIAAYREAIRLKPEFAKAYSALVLALKAQGKLDEAIAAYREAIRLEPDNAVAHLNLGGILRARGDFAGSLAMLRRGHELGSKQPGWPHPSAKWVAEAERRAALAERLTVILKGESSPKDNAERLALAGMCYDTRRFAAAARLSAEAMEIDPKLGEARLPDLRGTATVTTPPASPPWPVSVRERTTHAPTRPPGSGSAPRPATGSAPTSGCARKQQSAEMPATTTSGGSCT